MNELRKLRVQMKVLGLRGFRRRRVGGAAGALLAGLVVVAAAGPAGAATGSFGQKGGGDVGAVFVQNDAVTGNQVVVYDRSADGTLSQAGVYATGGLGGVLAGSVVDHLASQGSLTFDAEHHLLYAVNAGSNTVSVFGVHGDRLTLRQVIGSGGVFPVSVTVHGGLVYVLNALDGASIQGFRLHDGHLTAIPGSHRPLGLDPTATPQFTHTPGQIAFTPDGAQLIVTTKANGNAINVFNVDHGGRPSATPTVTVAAGAVPFAVAYDRSGHLAVANAGTNSVTTYKLRRDGTLTQVATTGTGQRATCWIAAAGANLYASNAGSATLTGLRSTRTGGLAVLGQTGTGPGTVDAAASPDGRFLYVQTGATGAVDAFRVQPDGSLLPIGSVSVPDAIGAEGIATA
jgi:6-phosphogluconolactonase (cycloisomerase 2 family)